MWNSWALDGGRRLEKAVERGVYFFYLLQEV
jgi:hypothetical protein